jgi:alkanesulfonate monooxygenase SsuD/methylene tetrahydromethanopterin reductase-like flavin-dependent oxidoreductase (luciferase family)
MHVGLVLECEYRRDGTRDGAFDEAVALASTAEVYGIDGLWVAERHFASPQRSLEGAGGLPSFASAPMILATALAARTSQVRIGIGVSVLPLAHPVRLAEEVATLDHISRGRLDFGVGRSGFPAAYAGYGVSYEESRERFQECLDILRLAWTNETFSYSGTYFHFNDVCVMPKPLQKPYPPVRVAATTNDTFPLVGRAGHPIFVGLRGTDIPETAASLSVYRDAWREAGHEGNGDVFLRIPVYVAETDEQAREEPQESTLSSYRRLAERYARSAEEFGTATSEQRAERGERLAHAGYDELLANRLAYGTPDAVARRLCRIRDDLGLSGFLFEPNVGGAIPRDRVFNSLRLLAREVVPALR